MREKTDEDLRRYYKIGEVSKNLNIPTYVIRFWIKALNLQITKFSNINRARFRFRKQDIDDLKLIHSLKNTGYSWKQIKKRLSGVTDIEIVGVPMRINP